MWDDRHHIAEMPTGKPEPLSEKDAVGADSELSAIGRQDAGQQYIFCPDCDLFFTNQRCVTTPQVSQESAPFFVQEGTLVDLPGSP